MLSKDGWRGRILPLENVMIAALYFYAPVALFRVLFSFSRLHFLFDQSLTSRKVPEEKVPPVLNPLGRLAEHPSYAHGLGPDFGG